jgi:hypothetical protein
LKEKTVNFLPFFEKEKEKEKLICTQRGSPRIARAPRQRREKKERRFIIPFLSPCQKIGKYSTMGGAAGRKVEAKKEKRKHERKTSRVLLPSSPFFFLFLFREKEKKNSASSATPIKEAAPTFTLPGV